MSNYRAIGPFNVPMFLFIPETKIIKGVVKKIYPTEGELIHCSFETKSNDVLAIEDTAVIETWYRPDVKADCIMKDVTGISYEILGTPEDINQRHQCLKFKIRKVAGGA